MASFSFCKLLVKCDSILKLIVGCMISLVTSQLNIEPNHTTLAGHAYEHDVIVASK